MKPLQKGLLFLYVLVTVFIHEGRAQLLAGAEVKGNLELVRIRAEAAVVLIRPLETFGHKITLSNTSDAAIKFRLQLRPNPYFRQINAINKPWIINAGDSIKVPLKLLNVNARVNGVYTVFFDMISEYDSTDKSIFEFQVEVYDGTDRQIMATPLQDNILIRNGIRQFTLPVLFRNLLPERKRIYLEMQNPVLNPIMLAHRFQIPISLPSEDTTLQLQFQVKDPNMDLWQLNQPVTVLVKDEHQNIISMFSATPRWLFNKGSMYLSDYAQMPTNNLQMEFNHVMMGEGNYSRDFRISKSLAPDAQGVGFNVHYQYYKNMDFQNLSGTHLFYRGEKDELTIGSINDFHELSLLGRGIKATHYFDEDKTMHMDVWAVDQELNLLRAFDNFSGTRTVSARFGQRSNDGTMAYDVTTNYFERQSQQSKGTLHYGNFSYRLSEKEQITAMLGYSNENFNFSQGDSSLSGYVVKADYQKNDPFLSYGISLGSGSRNYAGMLQGSIIGNARVSYNITNTSILSFHINKNTTDRPAYTRDAIQGRFLIDYVRSEINFSRQLKNIRYSIRPYYLQQAQLFTYTNTSEAPQKGVASRILFSINGQKKKLYYGIDLDAGQFSGKMSNGYKRMPASILSGSISMFGLSLGGMLQQGPNFITEFTNMKEVGQSFFNRIVNLSYGVSPFKNLRLDIAASMINNASVKGTILNFSQGIHWEIGKGFNAHSQVYVFKFPDIAFRYQARVGVTKTMHWDDKENRRVRVTLQLFEDRNNNGVKDINEPEASDIMVRFDNMILVSDKKGMVQVMNVKQEQHKVSVVYGNSRQQHYIERSFYIEGNSRLTVGVPPQYSLKGVVRAQQKLYDATTVQMDGVKVVLLDQMGTEFVTYSNASGAFELQLPPGTYRAYLPEMRRRGSAVKDHVLNIDPERGYTGAPVELLWIEAGRTIEIKKLH